MLWGRLLMKYYKVLLTNTYMADGVEHEIIGALNEECFLEVLDDETSNVRFCDAAGNTITLPEVQESRVIDINPERLEWMA